MKVVLIVVAAICCVGVGVVLAGYMLPRDHVVAMSARVEGSPAAIWAVITDPRAFPRWRSEVTQVDMLPPTAAGPSWREHAPDGTIAYVVARADPPRRLVTRIADRSLPFGGQWDYRIEPADGAGDASLVTITERGSVYNPVYRFVSRFVMGHTATIDRYLRALSRRFGTESVPARVAVA
jgi:Polyketide cyclase / dehydrase and lipid transport